MNIYYIHMWRGKKRNQGSLKTTVEISFCSQLHWGCPDKYTEMSPNWRNTGLSWAALSLVDFGGFVWHSAIRGFKIPYIFVTFLHCKGDQKVAAETDTGHAFRGVSPGQRGERMPCNVHKEAGGTAGAQISVLDGCLPHQELSCSLPVRGQEHFFPLPPSPTPARQAMSSRPVSWPCLGCRCPLPTWGPAWIAYTCVTSTACSVSVMSVGLAVSLGNS